MKPRNKEMTLIQEKDFPGLYQSSDQASINAQSKYYRCLFSYLGLLVIAAAVSFFWGNNVVGAIASALLFLITLGILIYLKSTRPDDLWYNGRAVAESVKTIIWKWMMRSDLYEENVNDSSPCFVNDLKKILKQNQSLSSVLNSASGINAPISEKMKEIRGLSFEERIRIYKEQRIDNQAVWYSKKANHNKMMATLWFVVSVLLHFIAISMLLYKIYDPTMKFPIEVIATATSAVLTWLQAKKHNELSSSYSLTAHEIALIKGEFSLIKQENDLSDFVINTENAFSREHTQWAARKVD